MDSIPESSSIKKIIKYVKAIKQWKKFNIF